jgi:capsular exopolysaccharide synthesis family protein
VAENVLAEPTLFSAAWRYRWLVILTTVVALALGVAYVVLRPTSTLFTARASVVVQATGSGLDLGTSGIPQRFVANQVEILRSAAVVELASQIADQQDPPLQLTPEDVAAGLGIDSSTSSDLIDVLFSYPDDADVAVGGANAVVDAYKQLVSSEKSAVSEAALRRIDTELSSLDEQAQTLANQITARINQDTTLTDLQRQYEDALQEIVGLQSEAKDADQTRLVDIRARLSDLRNLINTYQSIQGIGRNDPTLDELRAEQEQIVARRDALVERRDTISVDVELSPDVIAFSSPASSAVASPNSGPGRTMAVALAAGLFAGVGLAYLLASRRRVFRDRMEPELILGVPLLADIPDFTQEGLTTLLPVRDEPRSASAEAFRFAAASLELKMNRQEAKSLAIISPTLGAGKSTVLANIALAAARQGSRVLVIDADFGNQALTTLLAGDEGIREPGLTEVVSGGLTLTQAIRSIAVAPDLLISLLSRGRQPVAAADLIRSQGAQTLFATAKKEFDMVLVDAPPLLQVAYASTLAGLVDAVLVLVAHGGSVAQLEEALGRLGLIGVSALGYVYNSSPLRREMTVSEGSTADVLGDLRHAELDQGKGKSGSSKRRWR